MVKIAPEWSVLLGMSREQLAGVVGARAATGGRAGAAVGAVALAEARPVRSWRIPPRSGAVPRLFRLVAGRSRPRPEDTAGRHAGQLVGAPILGGEFLALCAGRPADDVAAVAAGKGRGLVPWPRVGYRTLDGENAAVEVRDDQVKRLGVGLSHGILLSRITLAGQAAEPARTCGGGGRTGWDVLSRGRQLSSALA